jgi:hypothetical protein
LPVCASFDGLRSLCRLPCPLVLLPSLGPPTLSWRSPTPPVAGLLGRLPLTGRPSAPWPGVPPLQSPQSARPGPPAGPGGFVHPRGSPLRSSRRGRAAAARVGRSAPPRVVGVRRPMPAVPLAVSGCPSAPWPGVPPPAVPLTCSSRPPAGPGGFAHPRGALPAFLTAGSGGRCSGWAAQRLRRSLGLAGRCPSWPTAVCPCVTPRLCARSRPPSLGGPGVLSYLVLCPLRGFLLVRRGFSGLLLVSVWGPCGLLRAGGLSCCP